MGPAVRSASGFATTPVYGLGMDALESEAFPYERGAGRPVRDLQGVAPDGPDRSRWSMALEVGVAAAIAVGAVVMWLWEKRLDVVIWGGVAALILVPGANYWF